MIESFLSCVSHKDCLLLLVGKAVFGIYKRKWLVWHFNDSWFKFSDHLKYCFKESSRTRDGASLCRGGSSRGWDGVAVPAIALIHSFILSLSNLKVDWQSVVAVVSIKWKVALLINCRPPGMNEWGGLSKHHHSTQLNSTQLTAAQCFQKISILFFSFLHRHSTLLMNKNNLECFCDMLRDNRPLTVFVRLIKLLEWERRKKTFAHSKRSVAVV